MDVQVVHCTRLLGEVVSVACDTNHVLGADTVR